MRDMLLKLATTKERHFALASGECPTRTPYGSSTLITYNLRKDYEREWIPFWLLVCLRMALIANKSKVSVLPKFVEFSRQGMNVSVVVDAYMSKLRFVIGDRRKMMINGQKLVTNLLLGL